jgi:hypothetical protein
VRERWLISALEKMTQPKTRYITRFGDAVRKPRFSNAACFKKSDELRKKPNGHQPLGCISSVSITDFSPDAILVGLIFSFLCEIIFLYRYFYANIVQFSNGRIVLPLKAHQWNKTDTSAKFVCVSTPNDFVSK